MESQCSFSYQIIRLHGVTLEIQDRQCPRLAVSDGRCFFHADSPDKPIEPFADEIARQSSSSDNKDLDLCGYVFPKTDFRFKDSIEKPIYMEGCTVYGNMSFKGLRFHDYASFHGSVFLGEVDFGHDADPYHRQTSFANKAVFNSVKFFKRASFSACRFERLPDFQGTEFRDIVTFGWANIEMPFRQPGDDWLEFRNCEFIGQADLAVRVKDNVSGLKFAHCNLEGLVIGTLPRNDIAVEFTNIRKWYEERKWYQWPRKKIRDEVSESNEPIKVIDSYRYLEKYFYDHSDFGLARHFYVGQMVGFRRDPNFDWSARLMNRLYQLFFNFGESILRPVCLLLLSALLFQWCYCSMEYTSIPTINWNKWRG